MFKKLSENFILFWQVLFEILCAKHFIPLVLNISRKTQVKDLNIVHLVHFRRIPGSLSMYNLRHENDLTPIRIIIRLSVKSFS